MKDKRILKGRKKESSVILKSGELVIQEPNSSVSGKAQKYSRVGPREYGSMCEKHFAYVVESGLVWDVLAGDHGLK